jgi:hypothetical protein
MIDYKDNYIISLNASIISTFAYPIDVFRTEPQPQPQTNSP